MTTARVSIEVVVTGMAEGGSDRFNYNITNTSSSPHVLDTVFPSTGIVLPVTTNMRAIVFYPHSSNASSAHLMYGTSTSEVFPLLFGGPLPTVIALDHATSYVHFIANADLTTDALGGKVWLV